MLAMPILLAKMMIYVVVYLPFLAVASFLAVSRKVVSARLPLETSTT